MGVGSSDIVISFDTIGVDEGEKMLPDDVGSPFILGIEEGASVGIVDETGVPTYDG